jgi:hypothetical protein
MLDLRGHTIVEVARHISSHNFTVLAAITVLIRHRNHERGA